jgi:hypothetical protein
MSGWFWFLEYRNQNQRITNSIYFKNLKEQQQQLVFMKEPVAFWALISPFFFHKN